jgi:hypothetical protein
VVDDLLTAVARTPPPEDIVSAGCPHGRSGFEA